MRNKDQIGRSTTGEIRNITEFWDSEGDGRLTEMEAFAILRNGNYVMGRDAEGTWHRISLSGTTEYLEAAESYEEARKTGFSEKSS